MIDDDYEDPPDGWEPTPEQWALLKDAPDMDPDVHMGGEREAAEGRRWLEDRKRERAKVKRLELRLRLYRALALGNHLAFLGAHADEPWLYRWANRRMRVGAIIRETRKELVNVD